MNTWFSAKRHGKEITNPLLLALLFCTQFAIFAFVLKVIAMVPPVAILAGILLLVVVHVELRNAGRQGFFYSRPRNDGEGRVFIMDVSCQAFQTVAS